MLKRTAARKRMEAKFQEVKENLRQRMHDTVSDPGEATDGWLRQVLRGYSQYHAIPGNLEALKRFREPIQQHWRRILRRRS